jgi:hypothetical protein
MISDLACKNHIRLEGIWLRIYKKGLGLYSDIQKPLIKLLLWLD